jgi:pyruvate/2-oxoacid:ferredoxin oxidoreductase alpha subunit
MNKQEILTIIDSTSNFNAYIEGLDTLNGQALDLVIQVAGVDGEDFTDEECLEVIKEIVDMTNAYRNTHKWED